MKNILHGTAVFVCSFLLWAAMFTSSAMAQLPTATILGVVKDSSGAVVPDTTVTSRNLETGQTRTATSAADGSYRFSALAVGAYEVRAEHPGFQTEVRSGLTLTVSAEAVVNFTLQVGAVTETVAVTAEAPLVNTTSGSLGELVGEQKVADLPLNGRNYIDLSLLQAGVNQHKNIGGLPIPNGTWFSASGAPMRSNNYMLDGAILVNSQGASPAGATGDTLGVEGTREIRVLTNSYSAEYGMNMGGQMVMVSKGGSNSFHGDVFEYLRNSALDARNFFDYPSAATGAGFRLPPFKRNQFGGSAGGPIKKDKTFVYGVYEGLRARTGLSELDTVMAAGCHGPAGATITNTACPDLGSTASVKVSPVTAGVLAAIPTPNLGPTRFTFPFTQPTRDDFGQIRVDHTFSSNDSIFARYTIDDTIQNYPIPASPYPQTFLIVNSRSQYGTLAENHIFSPALLSTARFSYSRTSPILNQSTTLTGPQYTFSPFDPLQVVPSVVVGGITTFGSTGAPNWRPQNLFSWSDDLFYTRGKHSLKFGTLINRFQQFEFNLSGTFGTVTFANVAGFLAGTPTVFTASNPGATAARSYRNSTLGFYAQDDYRVTPRLTLNLGLRYEFTTQLHEIFGIQSSMRDVQHDPAPTVGIPFVNPSLHNLNPRVGFAWDVTGDGKTAIRGGFGVYSDLIWWGYGIAGGLSNTRPFSSSSTITNPSPFNIPYTFPASATANTDSSFDYHMKQPHLLSYNLSVARQLPAGIALTIAYVGSRGVHLVSQVDGNPTVPNGTPVNGLCAATPAGQLANPFGGNFCWVAGAPYTNPNIKSVTLYSNQAYSFYNSLQVGLTKQLTKGLQFQGAYTWSHAMDTTPGTSTSDSTGYAGAVFPTLIALEYANSDFDTTQNLRFNAIYRLPGPSSGNAFLKGLLTGWQTSGILSLQTGYPFTPALTSNRSLSLNNSSAANIERPNLNAGRNAANIVSGTTAGCLGVTAGQKLGTPNLYFDPCAFSLQAPGFLGTTGRNLLRGPGLADLDFSLVKDTAIKHLGETGKLEFRAEVFNILNHANFLLPQGRSVFAGSGTSLAPQQALSNAGVITSTGTQTSRQIQLALKLIF
jgi:outer membrane receptor protein involved in Fe transport